MNLNNDIFGPQHLERIKLIFLEEVKKTKEEILKTLCKCPRCGGVFTKKKSYISLLSDSQEVIFKCESCGYC